VDWGLPQVNTDGRSLFPLVEHLWIVPEVVF
jgi:hypothetical protein